MVDTKNSNELEVVSVVIATYNSEKTLGKTLQALRKQSYPQNKLEIILVDGGSSDTTLQIAGEYGCIVVDNPKTEPVHAKLLGTNRATGKYLVTLDHDEVLENCDSILNRVNTLKSHPDCKVAFLSGYKRPKDYPLLNQYISEFGDPFSLYMYNFSKDYQLYEKALKKRCRIIEETNEYSYMSFEPNKSSVIVELCCLATMIDLAYFKHVIEIDSNSSNLVHAFYLMLQNGCTNVIISKNDPLVHYSVDSIKAYFPKLKWRIVNNVHFAEKGEKGFSGREQVQKVSKIKKYSFIPYSILFPISFLHGVVLGISRRNPVYLLHAVFGFYVAVEIIVQYVWKILGFTPSFKSYDGKKKIER